jgi:hypothetical protein
MMTLWKSRDAVFIHVLIRLCIASKNDEIQKPFEQQLFSINRADKIDRAGKNRLIGYNLRLHRVVQLAG